MGWNGGMIADDLGFCQIIFCKTENAQYAKASIDLNPLAESEFARQSAAPLIPAPCPAI
jgi:hypothetical protein